MSSASNSTITAQFQCSLCSMKFTTKIDFFRHMFYHREKSFRCEYCGDQYSYLGLRKHIMETHTLKNCELCDEVLEETALNEHKKVHKETTMVSHSYKNGEHVKRNETERDVKIKNKNNEISRCHVCDMHIPVQYHLTTRLISHTHNRQYKCKKCVREFKIICKRKFKEKGSENGKNKKIVVFMCDLCSMKFTTVELLEQHLDKVHSNLDFYECKTCNVQFKNLGILKKHNRLKHNKIVGKI